MSDVAWAAGLFEGEGSILYNPSTRALMLSVGSTDKDVLDRFAEVIGGKVRGPYRPNGAKTPASRKDIWHWRLSGLVESARVLRAFWPYLGERRKAKAADAIASYYLDTRPRNPRRRNLRAQTVKV